MSEASKQYQNTSTRKFRKWWRGICNHPAHKQTEIIGKWLHYAKKTAALKTDQNGQRVVYTIEKRFRNSEYKQISRANAYRVFCIINQHQDNFRQMRDRLRAQWVAEIQRAAEPEHSRPGVVVKRTTTKHIITGGKS